MNAIARFEVPPRQAAGDRYDPQAPEPDFLFEVVDGQIVRKTVGTGEVRIANRLNRALGPYLDAAGKAESYVELGYALPGGRLKRKPDLSVLSFSRWPKDRPFPPGDFIPAVPELAVEVISPREPLWDVRRRIGEYFAAGVQAVWVILPDAAEAHCYSAPTEVRILTRADDLTGEPVVPGFRLPLADLFPAESAEPPQAGDAPAAGG
jgi:Uma2 family endonuclease